MTAQATPASTDLVMIQEASGDAVKKTTLQQLVENSGATLGSPQDIYLRPYQNEPPAANYATAALINGRPVLDFDDSADESAVFSGALPSGYAGGGLTVTLVWTAGVAANSCFWDASIERIADDGFDLTGDSFAAVQSANAVPATVDQPNYTAITFTNGAQMDSLAASEAFRIKITRDADNASDLMVGDARLLGVIIKET